MQMSHFTAEKKANIFKTHGGSATNTGSIEAQIAMLTERIQHISAHLKQNKKDFTVLNAVYSWCSTGPEPHAQKHPHLENDDTQKQNVHKQHHQDRAIPA